MRVAILTRADLFPPVHGAAVKIVRTAEALCRLGCHVCVVTEDRDLYWRLQEGGAGPRWTSVPYPPRPRAAQEWPPLPRWSRHADSLLARLGYPSEEGFLYRPMVDPAWWIRALTVGLAEDIQVFHAEFPGFGVPAALAARALGGRSLVVEHNVEFDRLAQSGSVPQGALARLMALERWVLGAVDDVVAVSATDRELLARAGVDPGRVTVIPHGVDLEPYTQALARRQDHGAQVRARYGLTAHTPLLFFHGVLHYGPNLEAVRLVVEHLLPRLLPAVPQLRVILAGMNPPRYFQHPAVILPGVVEDLPAHVVAADVAICPLRAGGGTRMKLLEYFAGGRAVVSTPKGAEGLRCVHGTHLRLHEDMDDFARAVLELLQDPDQRQRLGDQARRFALRHDWSAVGRACLELYQGRSRGRDWGEDWARPTPVALTALLLLDRRCNLRCAFCDVPSAPGEASLPWERVPALLDEMVAIGTRNLVLTGGEPFLYPDLFRIVGEARRRGMGVNITTNGTLVESRWDQLLSSGVDSVAVSLDGREGPHDAMRGPGTWRRARQALDRLVAWGGTGVSVHMVVTRLNVDDLEATWELARSLGAGFDFWPVNHAPDLALSTPRERARYREQVEALARRDPEVEARRAYLLAGADYHGGRFLRVRCLGLQEQYGILPDGTLLPCCVWGRRELEAGNVFQTPLSVLWRSDRVQALRARIQGEGCGAGCYNHSLHAFSAVTGESFVAREAEGWAQAGPGPLRWEG